MEEINMKRKMTKKIARKQNGKECRECGNQIIEQQESVLYECERCIGKHEG